MVSELYTLYRHEAESSVVFCFFYFVDGRRSYHVSAVYGWTTEVLDRGPWYCGVVGPRGACHSLVLMRLRITNQI